MAFADRLRSSQFTMNDVADHMRQLLWNRYGQSHQTSSLYTTSLSETASGMPHVAVSVLPNSHVLVHGTISCSVNFSSANVGITLAVQRNGNTIHSMTAYEPIDSTTGEVFQIEVCLVDDPSGGVTVYNLAWSVTAAAAGHSEAQSLVALPFKTA